MIMAARKDKNIFNEQGQAIIETMLFLPVIIYFLVFLTKAGSAINTSINQQKSTRSYTYYLLKGNSNGMRQMDFDRMDDFTLISSFMLGFREKATAGGDNSFGTCHSIPNLPWLAASGQNCDDGPGIGNPGDNTFIKVFTMYGVCAGSYAKIDTGDFHTVDYPTSSNVLSSASCSYK